MKAAEQLKVLSTIWKKKGNYVFLPWIPAAQARIKDQRRANWNEGPAFLWPRDKPKILDHLEEHANDDLYFSPMMFSQPYRRTEYSAVGNRLWADLDSVDPRDIEDFYKPTIAWETSPDRFAAIWLMNNDRPNPTAPGGENHRLTTWLGADPSGWDSTQLLRVPGSANNKPDKPRGTRGELVWPRREIHPWNKMDDLPQVPQLSHTEENIDEQILEGVNRRKVWARVKPKVHKSIRKFLAMGDTGDYDRSEVLWQIERELADAGCTLPEIVAIVRPTVWNKFEGRQDELKRLIIDASKALSQVNSTNDSILDDSEADIELQPFWADDDYLNAPEPEWLVERMVPSGGCGFIAGIPKSLKSWLSLDLAISLTTGSAWLGTPTKPVNVLYIQEEDPATLVRDRHSIIAASKDPSYELVKGLPAKAYPGNLYMSIYRGFDGTDVAWHTWLSDKVKEHEISLVIFDTMATIAPGVDIDSGREVKGELLDPLKDVARDTGAAMLIVHHMTKSPVSDRPGQNMAGSGQVHAWADFGLYVTHKEEKTGTITVTFAHETKYTGSNVHKYVIDGLDATPRRWDPQRLEDSGHVTPSHTNLVKARMLEAVGNPDDIDPLGVDMDLTATRRLQRAYVKARMEEGAIAVEELAEDMSLAAKTVTKYINFLQNDYPHLTTMPITY